jgi:hypothetical protein
MRVRRRYNAFAGNRFTQQLKRAVAVRTPLATSNTAGGAPPWG